MHGECHHQRVTRSRDTVDDGRVPGGRGRQREVVRFTNRLNAKKHRCDAVGLGWAAFRQLPRDVRPMTIRSALLLMLALISCQAPTISGAQDATISGVQDATAASQEASTDKAKSLRVLFDGRTLDGWRGREDLWSVEDGQIVGRTNDHDPIEANTFLIYDADEVADFELELQFKIESGNSGVQYRSQVKDEEQFIVGGYQADIDFGNKYAGILYEERGRGILATRGQRVEIAENGESVKRQYADPVQLGRDIHPGRWNDFRVVARGNHLEHYINDVMTAEVIDNQSDKRATEGVFALQLHRGPAMVVRFKDIVLRPLD